MTKFTKANSEAGGGKPRALQPVDIEALMAIPPRPAPSIIVIGDDSVTSITLPPQRPKKT